MRFSFALVLLGALFAAPEILGGDVESPRQQVVEHGEQDGANDPQKITDNVARPQEGRSLLQHYVRGKIGEYDLGDLEHDSEDSSPDMDDWDDDEWDRHEGSACRTTGGSSGEEEYDYYIAPHAEESFAKCQQFCQERNECKGFEYREANAKKGRYDGKCELWKINHSNSEYKGDNEGYTCYWKKSGGGCNVANPHYLGDGDCDHGYNTEECDWDGGDCCASTCVPTERYDCATHDMDCKDPLAYKKYDGHACRNWDAGNDEQGVKDHDWDLYKGQDKDGCKERCSESDECKAFEWRNDGRCELWTTTVTHTVEGREDKGTPNCWVKETNHH